MQRFLICGASGDQDCLIIGRVSEQYVICSLVSTHHHGKTWATFSLCLTIFSVVPSHIYRSALVRKFLENLVHRVSDHSLYQSLVWLFGWGDGPTFAIFLLHIYYTQKMSAQTAWVMFWLRVATAGYFSSI